MQPAPNFRWSIIDRWHMHPGFIAAMADSVRRGLSLFDEAVRSEVVLQFSAHSLPLDVIDRGDAYPQEVGATVQAVLAQLGVPNPYVLSYQSAVGPVRWLGPNTEQVVREFGRQGRHRALIVPIAFTSDHIETLHEIDIELAETAQRAGVEMKRAPAMNDSPLFVHALADIVAAHLRSGERCSTQYSLRCPGCTNIECRAFGPGGEGQ
jgi:ferrochelatase